jgi:hypothetical protein
MAMPIERCAPLPPEQAQAELLRYEDNRRRRQVGEILQRNAAGSRQATTRYWLDTDARTGAGARPPRGLTTRREPVAGRRRAGSPTSITRAARAIRARPRSGRRGLPVTDGGDLNKRGSIREAKARQWVSAGIPEASSAAPGQKTAASCAPSVRWVGQRRQPSAVAHPPDFLEVKNPPSQMTDRRDTSVPKGSDHDGSTTPRPAGGARDHQRAHTHMGASLLGLSAKLVTVDLRSGEMIARCTSTGDLPPPAGRGSP